jgi:hypothetical protein
VALVNKGVGVGSSVLRGSDCEGNGLESDLLEGLMPAGAWHETRKELPEGRNTFEITMPAAADVK